MTCEPITVRREIYLAELTIFGTNGINHAASALVQSGQVAEPRVTVNAATGQIAASVIVVAAGTFRRLHWPETITEGATT